MESQSLDNMMNNYIQKKAAEGDPTFRAPSAGFNQWASKQQMPEDFYRQAVSNGLDPNEEWAKVLEQTNRGSINQFMNDQGNRDMATMGAGAALGGGLGYLVGGDATSALMGTALGGLVGWVAKTFFNADINTAYEKVMAMHNNGTLSNNMKKWQANSDDPAIQSIQPKDIDKELKATANKAGDATFERLAKKGEITPHDPNAPEEKASEEVNSEPLPKEIQDRLNATSKSQNNTLVLEQDTEAPNKPQVNKPVIPSTQYIDTILDGQKAEIPSAVTSYVPNISYPPSVNNNTLPEESLDLVEPVIASNKK